MKPNLPTQKGSWSKHYILLLSPISQGQQTGWGLKCQVCFSLWVYLWWLTLHTSSTISSFSRAVTDNHCLWMLSSAGPSAPSSIPQSWFMNTLVPAFLLSPSPGALVVLHFTPHALLIRVDHCRDKISPVTKQGLWNHSTDWVCSAWWEDEL